MPAKHFKKVFTKMEPINFMKNFSKMARDFQNFRKLNHSKITHYMVVKMNV